MKMGGLNRDWKVLPHGPLERVSENLMTVTGDLHTPMGTMPRRMTVARLSDRRLIIYSVLSLNDAGMTTLEAFGTPAILVVPGYRHRLDIAAWQTRYPSARIVTPAAARAKVEEAVMVDRSDLPIRCGSISIVDAAGTGLREAVMEVRDGEELTVVLNDIIFALAKRPGLTGLVQRIAGFAGPKPHIPAMIRRSWVDDPIALAEQMAGWGQDRCLKRIIVSHGPIIDEAPAATLKTVAADLRGYGVRGQSDPS